MHAPAIPYLGLLLRDITYAVDGSPDFFGKEGKVRQLLFFFYFPCNIFFRYLISINTVAFAVSLKHITRNFS
jgi:hypothetical protein